MPDPRDPDTEDRRNDRDLDDNEQAEPDADIDEVVVDFELYDNDDSIIVDFDLDDLRDMEGPDA